MLVYEIDNSTIREYRGNIKAIIAAGEYVPRDDDFVRRAFNLGTAQCRTLRDTEKTTDNIASGMT